MAALVTVVVLLGAAPARGAITIDVPCAAGWNWNATTQTLTCGTVTPPPPGTPSGCVLTPNPTSRTDAGPVILTVACSVNGGNLTSFAWTASGGVAFDTPTPTTTNTNGATISATTTFTVVASNDVGPGTLAQAIVSVGGVAPGLSCPGFSKTIVVNWDWASTLAKVDTWQTQSGLGTNGILVIPFIPTAPGSDAVTSISATGYPAGQMQINRTAAISNQPCDLNPPAPARIESKSPTVFYVLGTSPISYITGKPTAAALVPGTQYYINVANRKDVSAANPSGTPTCVAGGAGYPNCEVRLTFQKPSGH